MQWRMLGILGIVMLLLVTGVSGVYAHGICSANCYDESLDVILAKANEEDFPALYGYDDLVFSVYLKTEQNGTANISLSIFNISSFTFTNVSVTTVSQENLTEETSALAVMCHNRSIYIGWVEKEGFVLSTIENGNLTNTTRIWGIASYYHPPSIATFGKKVRVTFLCGNQTGNATLVSAERDENGNFKTEVLATLPYDSLTPRWPTCGYDIYGNTHVFLGNLSWIEHYYSNGSTWLHEKINTSYTIASEINVRFVNNQCYFGFIGVSSEHMNTVLGRGEIALNGSIGEIETLTLTSFTSISNGEIFYTGRVYISTLGTKTIYATWSERDADGNLTMKGGKIVEWDLVNVQAIGQGKVCGTFAGQYNLHILVIENGFLHYKVFKIQRDLVSLTILETTPTTVTLGWSRCYDEDFAWYEIHYSTVGNFTPSQATLYATVYVSQQTVYCVENLDLGREFFFLIVVRFTTNESILSNFVSYKTPTPVEQVNATVSNVSADRFTVCWEAKNCEKFEVHYSLAPDFINETVVELDNTTTTYTFDSLDAGTTYFVFVRSIGFYGEFADSQIISILTLPEMIEAIANIDEISISWQKPGARFFEKLEVYGSRNNNTVFDTASLITVIYEPTISNLTMKFEEINATFYFGIIIYNTLWQSAKSNIISNTTYLPVIPSISITKYEILNATSVKIYFSKIDYSYYSHLEIHLSLEKNFTPSAKTLFHTIYTSGETASVIYGLTPDVDYYVQIVLIDVFGQKSFSGLLKVRTTTSIECEHPQPEVPFYLYGLLLIIFFLSSIISALCSKAIRQRKHK